MLRAAVNNFFTKLLKPYLFFFFFLYNWHLVNSKSSWINTMEFSFHLTTPLDFSKHHKCSPNPLRLCRTAAPNISLPSFSYLTRLACATNSRASPNVQAKCYRTSKCCKIISELVIKHHYRSMKMHTSMLPIQTRAQGI